MNRPLCVIVFAGPSGGHLFPAFAFSEQFKRKRPESRILLVTGRRGRPMAASLPAGVFDTILDLPDFPLPHSPSGVISFLKEIFTAFGRTQRLLDSEKPDLVVGFGSYTSFPGILFSRLRRIPTVIHEQNVVPGRATRWLVPFADGVAVSFPPSRPLKPRKRFEVTGLPIRRALREAAERSNRTRKVPLPLRILVLGGSQGARVLNRVFMEAVSGFSDEEKRKIAVTHITGRADWQSGQVFYQKQQISFQCLAFCDTMHDIYAKTDLAVCRAGANSLFELALFGIPALVVPYPYAGGHQMANAEFFESAGAILLKREDTFKPDWLRHRIRDWMGNPGRLAEMSGRIRSIAQLDAAQCLVEFTEAVWTEKKP